MKEKKIDTVEVWKEAVEAWKELEDELATRLQLTVIERTVYYHLLRHSRLEGKVRVQFSIPGLASSVGVSIPPVRAAMRRLADHGALRHIERSNLGHLVEVRLPSEVPACPVLQPDAGGTLASPTTGEGNTNLDELDFFRVPALRRAIHAREGGLCFYCRRRTPSRSVDYSPP